MLMALASALSEVESLPAAPVRISRKNGLATGTDNIFRIGRIRAKHGSAISTVPSSGIPAPRAFGCTVEELALYAW